MDVMQLFSEETWFGNYKIVRKLSTHHDGEREVYLVKGKNFRDTVLTVFNLGSERYAPEDGDEPKPEATVQDIIPEVRFFDENRNLEGVPTMLDCGIDTYEGRRLGWMAQEYVEGISLHSHIRSLGTIEAADALAIASKVGEVVERVARFTRGGGHYGISTDNIIVRHEGNEIADVRLIGFSNIGPSCAGKASLDAGSLDKRFHAPEAARGIFSVKSDIHSLGMVMLAMLAGYPSIINTGTYTLNFGSCEINMDEVSVLAYYDSIWKKADESLPQALKLILRKATAVSPAGRISSVGSFLKILSKTVGNGTGAGPARNDSRVAPSVEDRTGREDADTAADKKDGGTRRKEKEETRPAAEGISKPGKKARKASDGLDAVAGMADLKALFRRDFIRIVKNPDVAGAYGIKPSNCTLLYGPQGCGKTFIAEKAAQEAGLKYRIVRPSDLGSIYIHGAQQKIAETFAEAEKKGPMILIFDEFDALVPKRSAEMNENQANEVNEMLAQLNNCAERGIFCLCTTNRPDRIDPAVMRKGRVDRSIYVSLPDFEARREIFRLALDGRPVDESIDYDSLASATDKYTCSDITFIVEETARTCFEKTLDDGLAEPMPITMERLMEVVAVTNPSVSEAQNKEFLELKTKMENKDGELTRKKLGFVAPV